MKVLKEGVIPKPITLSKECYFCHSILEIERKDVIESGSYGGYGDSSTKSFQAKCEFCKKLISIEDPISWR